MPYLFEKKYASRHPIANLLNAVDEALKLNVYTIQSLRKNGIEVLTFEGKYLADGGGGPHCLTMPLLRRD